jgi:gas vesicle protein/uncharacterized protein YoxC
MADMDVLLAVCMIVGTLAIVTIAFFALRAVRHLESVSDEFKRTAEAARVSMSEMNGVTRQLHELTLSLEGVVTPLQRSALRVERLADRATDLSTSVLEEVARPLETTMSFIRGVQAGTRSLVGALRRPRFGRTQTGGMVMNESTQDYGRGSGAGVMGFLMGAAIGAGVALLFAPATGVETRRRLGEATKGLRNRVGDQVGDVRGRIGELKQDVGNAVDAGRQAFTRDRETRRTQGSSTVGSNIEA